MASHERYTTSLNATPERRLIIQQIRKRHFRGVQISDEDIAHFLWEIAFTIPDQLRRAINCLARYRDSEWGTEAGEPLHQLTVAAALHGRKGKAKA